MKTPQTLKFIQSLVLVGCLLSAPQAFGNKWDLSDAKPNQPVCINCCMSSLHQSQCDAESEKRHLDSFSVTVYEYAPVICAIVPILTVAALKYYPVLGIFGIFFSIKQISLGIMWHNYVSSNSELSRFETDTGEPEGIVLELRAVADWNGALSFFNSGPLRRRHLVLTYTASTFSDISDAIRNVRTRFNLPVKVLILNAHGGWFGNVFQMGFGEEYLEMSNLYRIQEVISLLNKDTIIILKSCRAGLRENSEVLSQTNIVQAIASIAEGRKIYSTADYSTQFFEIQADLSKVRYRGSLTGPFHLFEVLSFYTLDIEHLLDLPRCYQSTPNGEVLRCPQ